MPKVKPMPHERFTTVAVFAARLALEYFLDEDNTAKQNGEPATQFMLRGRTDSFTLKRESYMVLNFKIISTVPRHPLWPRVARVIVKRDTDKNTWTPCCLRFFMLSGKSRDYEFDVESTGPESPLLVRCRLGVSNRASELVERLSLSGRILAQWLV